MKGYYRMRFFIEFESYNRDFYWRSVLASKLSKLGHEVILGHVSNLSNYVISMKLQGVFFAKDCVPNRRVIFKELKDNKVVNIVLDEEGFVSSLQPEKFKYFRFNNDCTPYIDLVFVNSKYEKQLLLEIYPHLINKLVLCLSPRHTMFQNNNAYCKEAENIKRKFGNFIFIPLSMSNKHIVGSNKRKNQLKMMADYMKSSGGKVDLKLFIDFYNKMLKNNLDLVKLIIKVAKIRKDLNFVVRPHPSESLSKFKESFLDLPSNVFIEIDFIVQPYIDESTAVVHSNCTSGIDSFFLKKTTFNYTSNLSPSKKISKIYGKEFSSIKDLEVELLKEDWESPSFDKLSSQLYRKESELRFVISLLNTISLENVSTWVFDKTIYKVFYYCLSNLKKVFRQDDILFNWFRIKSSDSSLSDTSVRLIHEGVIKLKKHPPINDHEE